jgi:hypothetical protein
MWGKIVFAIVLLFLLIALSAFLHLMLIARAGLTAAEELAALRQGVEDDLQGTIKDLRAELLDGRDELLKCSDRAARMEDERATLLAGCEGLVREMESAL